MAQWLESLDALPEDLVRFPASSFRCLPTSFNSSPEVLMPRLFSHMLLLQRAQVLWFSTSGYSPLFLGSQGSRRWRCFVCRRGRKKIDKHMYAALSTHAFSFRIAPSTQVTKSLVCTPTGQTNLDNSSPRLPQCFCTVYSQDHHTISLGR